MGIRNLKYNRCVVDLGREAYELVNIYLVNLSKKRTRIGNESIYFLDDRDSQVVAMNPDTHMMRVSDEVEQRVRTEINKIIDKLELKIKDE